MGVSMQSSVLRPALFKRGALLATGLTLAVTGVAVAANPTVSKGTARVNGLETVADRSQLYVTSREYVNSQEKSAPRPRPGLCLVPCSLNQSEYDLSGMRDASQSL